MAKLIPIRHDSGAFERLVRPHEIPAAREPGQSPAGHPEEPARPGIGRPVRLRHAARHARSSDPRPGRRNSLSIRSAERRRWAADLTGPKLIDALRAQPATEYLVVDRSGDVSGVLATADVERVLAQV